MNVKFRIRKRSREQGNLTGKPWLVDFPDGHRYTGNSQTMTTCDGVCCNTFEQARAYMARRLSPGWPS